MRSGKLMLKSFANTIRPNVKEKNDLLALPYRRVREPDRINLRQIWQIPHYTLSLCVFLLAQSYSQCFF
jgi:hypothetical protein